MGTPYTHRQVTKAGQVKDPQKISRHRGTSSEIGAVPVEGGGGRDDWEPLTRTDKSRKRVT